MYARYTNGVKTHHQDYDIENRLRYVRDDTTSGQYTEFFYDASGQRVLTIQPDGTEIYTPFVDYEEEHLPTARRAPISIERATQDVTTASASQTPVPAPT
ncbi:hypothetical protein KC573_03615, partial [candidate division WWE3 bacterium]|nr:hypothetical protein [candidate division WWE3 bacterium]